MFLFEVAPVVSAILSFFVEEFFSIKMLHLAFTIYIHHNTIQTIVKLEMLDLRAYL